MFVMKSSKGCETVVLETKYLTKMYSAIFLGHWRLSFIIQWKYLALKRACWLQGLGKGIEDIDEDEEND